MSRCTRRRWASAADSIFIARVTSHIPEKGQVTVRYYGLYSNAHQGKVRKASVSPLVLRMAEEEE